MPLAIFFSIQLNSTTALGCVKLMFCWSHLDCQPMPLVGVSSYQIFEMANDPASVYCNIGIEVIGARQFHFRFDD